MSEDWGLYGALALVVALTTSLVIFIVLAAAASLG